MPIQSPSDIADGPDLVPSPSVPRSFAMFNASLLPEHLARSRHSDLLQEAERSRLARRHLARHRLRRKALRAERAALRARLALASL
ncbi:MAG TPA: hypothetical protein VMI11_03905 [Actinomycetes bacterium]|nr:hypothetical protein [Actinomycetes bacterium]